MRIRSPGRSVWRARVPVTHKKIEFKPTVRVETHFNLFFHPNNVVFVQKSGSTVLLIDGTPVVAKKERLCMAEGCTRFAQGRKLVKTQQKRQKNVINLVFLLEKTSLTVRYGVERMAAG